MERHNEKPKEFVCKFCKKGYSTRKSLAIHQKTWCKLGEKIEKLQFPSSKKKLKEEEKESSTPTLEYGIPMPPGTF